MSIVVGENGKIKAKEVITNALQAPYEGKYKWWHGLLALTATTIVGILQSGSKAVARKRYRQQNVQAPWAPPAWLFGPAWIVNNVALMWALVKILNDESTRNRAALLSLQVGIWAIYLSFGYVYFKKRSTILAEVWTQADALLATASFVVAFRGSKNIALAYLPLLAWTWYASSVSGYQLLKNEDPLFGTPPPMK